MKARIPSNYMWAIRHCTNPGNLFSRLALSGGCRPWHPFPPPLAFGMNVKQLTGTGAMWQVVITTASLLCLVILSVCVWMWRKTCRVPAFHVYLLAIGVLLILQLPKCSTMSSYLFTIMGRVECITA